MFRGGLDPGYYENPSALTYLFYGLFRLRFTAGFPSGAAASSCATSPPTPGGVPDRARRWSR